MLQTPQKARTGQRLHRLGSAVWMLSVGSASLPTAVFGTCQHAQRLSTHGRLSLLLCVRQRAARVATDTTSGAQKPHGRPQPLKPTQSHAADQQAPAKPRIMLIGWLGAQTNHLNKCATSPWLASELLKNPLSGFARRRFLQVCTALAEQGLRHLNCAATNGGHRATFRRRRSRKEVPGRPGEGAFDRNWLDFPHLQVQHGHTASNTVMG